jgi:hypothetical protein
MSSMRILGVFFLMISSVLLVAQDGGGRGRGAGRGPAITNLKILSADTTFQQLVPIMENYEVSLGVQCTYCHAEGNFASDDIPKKNIARAMMRMVIESNKGFPDGKAHIGCWTCHRGSTAPEMNPPANLLEEAARAGAARGGRGGPPRQ